MPSNTINAQPRVLTDRMRWRREISQELGISEAETQELESFLEPFLEQQAPRQNETVWDHILED